MLFLMLPTLGALQMTFVASKFYFQQLNLAFLRMLLSEYVTCEPPAWTVLWWLVKPVIDCCI